MDTARPNAESGTAAEKSLHDAIAFEEPRLRRYIRQRVFDRQDAEDVLQEVFYEFVLAYRLLKPVEHAGAWLFQVARNRITDRFRRRSREALPPQENPMVDWADLLPSPDAGPDAQYARAVLLERIEDALAELSPEQHFVFVAHEIEGRSFEELARETGVNRNTLISRKFQAVRHLRRSLEEVYGEYRKG